MNNNKTGSDFPYNDIINLPHHTSPKRKHMPLLDRAAQFSPFAALTGYDEDVKEAGRLTDEKLGIDFDDYKQDTMDAVIRYLEENPGCNRRITVTYFVPDMKKGGGKYLTVDGIFKYVDISDMSLCLKDGTRINKNDIYDLKLSDDYEG
ncbi:MAG: hypothetical protein IJL20_10390 [Lachnospiraceae bacterium]|nr:hypothetical protein [Lachnospiraceae bacterium]